MRACQEPQMIEATGAYTADVITFQLKCVCPTNALYRMRMPEAMVCQGTCIILSVQ